jgi:hypothetical protein
VLGFAHSFLGNHCEFFYSLPPESHFQTLEKTKLWTINAYIWIIQDVGTPLSTAHVIEAKNLTTFARFISDAVMVLALWSLASIT